MGELPVPFPHDAIYFAFGLLFLDRIPFVKGLLAFCEADQHLGLAAHEIDLERDEREALLRHFPGELADLFLMQQKLSRAERVVVRQIALGIVADVPVQQEHLLVLHNGVAVGQVCKPQAQGFHFRAQKRDPRFNGLFDEVVVVRLAVRSNCGIVFFFSHNSVIRKGRCSGLPTFLPTYFLAASLTVSTSAGLARRMRYPL